MEKTLLEVMVMKRNSLESRRYIYDALYGIIHLPDFIWKVISSTELQHLREVRLCDINSLCLTGGANINRYEHAIGTCYLAIECVRNWPQQNPISKKEKKQIVLAALLHDVANPAFGHSIEHVESKDGFEHEKSFENLIFGRKTESYQYRSATLEPIYFGMFKDLATKESKENLRAIGKIIEGEGKFGPLINGTMDLDNIDNVFRLAYHIGIIKLGEVPLNLARSLWIENGDLVIKENAVSYVEEWFKVRKKLYSFLLLNPEEFSGKCMLREASELAKTKQKHAFNWFDVDYELLKRLSEMPLVREEEKDYLFTIDTQFRRELNNRILSENLLNEFQKNEHGLSNKASVAPWENGWKIYDKSNYYVKSWRNELRVYKLVITGVRISEIVQRLMKGELYGCIGIFSTERVEKAEIFRNVNDRKDLEDELSSKIRKKFGGRFKNAKIRFHPIIDVNKTERQVDIRTDSGRNLSIGKPSRRLLIGTFFRNPHLNMHKIKPALETVRQIRKEIQTYLSDYLEDAMLQEVELYAEAEQDK